MPAQTCLSNVLSTRFDFGVPLEDVFPPNDIHPRLKYLFGKAFESYIKYECNIKPLLDQEQGTMKERFELKEKLVLNLDYHIGIEEFSPGTYFWALRHFLGLLPICLLPSYTKGVEFNWTDLAYECKRLLQTHDDERTARQTLDYEISQAINMIPFEHFLLLNVLISFIRRLSIKPNRRRPSFDRKATMYLSKYYCSSIFSRPFRPGHYSKCDIHLPLLLYLILRWKKISKHCESIGHPAYFLESDFKNVDYYKYLRQRDCGTQTNILGNAFFNTEVITICRNIPYFVNICKDYLKNTDSGCPTDCEFPNQCFSTIFEENEETEESGNKIQNTHINESEKAYRLAYVNDIPKDNMDNDGADQTLYQTATDFSFESVLEKEDRQDWQNVIKETRDTVKKVEDSYIYDDYETFKKEEFNQIGRNKSRSSFSKKHERKNIKRTSTPQKITPENDNSYINYPDVCDDINFENDLSIKTQNVGNHSKTIKDKPENHTNSYTKYPDVCDGINFENNISRETKNAGTQGKTIKDKSENHTKQKSLLSQRLFQDDSPRSIQAENSKQNLQNGDGNKKKKKKYSFKGIRMTLRFLRTLTPKKSTFENLESRVKYYKIKNGRSGTK